MKKMNKDIIIKIATEANISKYFSLEEIGIDNYVSISTSDFAC